MTDSAAVDSALPLEISHPGRRRILSVLCVTEITSWGILYYAFPVLSPAISADTGWSTTSIVAAFSISQFVAALVGVPVGRILDRRGPRWVMSAGSILAIPALVLIATSPTLPLFFLGWFVAGIAMGAVLYPPAFAALTRWWGTDRVRALMILTLAAGLASTVFAPLTAILSSHSDWRRTYLVLAVVLLVVTVPAHSIGLRGQWPSTGESAHARAVPTAAQTVRSRPFVMLTAAMSVTGFVAFAGIFNLVPLLIEHGADTALAATALGLGGAGQVLGRIGYLPLQRFAGTRTRTVGIIAATALSTILLGVASSVVALIAVAIGAGLARGLFTLVQATAITDRWGPSQYGHLSGIMSAPIVIAMASAPWAGAVLAEWTGSYSGAYVILGLLALTAVGLAALSMPTTVRQPKA
ncbi:MFS transporter [Rhodococcus sp. IEGM 1401]|uniref:MFS transporter n=1 Tax=unclassified Rhodococcus (in: high G+C Gram-positive bacteria) TaxID=192944 RepID=UPI0022B51662|nr:MULTISPECIES: MFS transporter [unclassified Rhodococcus (in: high G+C Gram-positive bacteria)]MCZ4560768.1 MFS transporter [Rhodococcus sp. IEGM 1401]MDI9920908.1 MFS transporter [Rhodococcus sp. IEGM 1372]MDV8033491.1 MFS transporter [Rhodococcus sp. IEGM 1414]MDV8077423.1 MFS transporter [Rhodococcus sp. IEGM 1370]